MIKLKLNELLTNLDGSQVIYTSYKSGQKIEAGYKFCNILYDFIMNKRTVSDSETIFYYTLAKKLYNLSQLAEPTIEEFTDEEYMLCQELLKNQPLIVKARFLEMVDELNINEENTIQVEE